jgi:hypothetical protein
MSDAAIALGRAGYRVHPCNPENKRPLTRWSTEATTTEAEIARWWARWPDALIGLCTGDGLVVIDDDRGGEQPEPELAVTRTAKTRSRGWHHYFTADRADIGNRVGLIPGLDVRGEGGYVIAPPSPGWEWLDAGAPLTPLPSWVVTIMTVDRGVRGRFGAGFTPRAPANPVAEGGRNDYIARFTGWYLRSLEASGEPTPDYAALAGAVLGHNARVCLPPLPEDEVGACVRSIYARHTRRA